MLRIRRSALAVAIVCAGPLAAQAPAPAVKRPYELTADFALASSQGNQRVTTLSFGERYSYTFPKWKLAQVASVLSGTANGKKNAELYQGSLRADFTLIDGLTNYAAVTALRNTPSGIRMQLNEGIGLGYKLLRSPTDKMQISAGMGALQRKFVVGKDEEALVANLGTEYRHNFSTTAYIEQTASFTPNFDDAAAWLFTSKSAMIAPLSSHLGIKVGYLVNYNHLPPLLPPKDGVPQTGRFKQFDGLLTTGVQFTY